MTITSDPRPDTPSERIYRPEVLRDRAFTVYQKPEVPAHWHGWVPDPEAQRRTTGGTGDAPVASALLRSSHSDLSVLVWATFWTWYHENDGELNYDHLAWALCPPPITADHAAEIRAAARDLLGSFILPRHVSRKRLYRLDFCDGFYDPTSRPVEGPNGMIRGEQFADLRVSGGRDDRSIQPADLVNFARWTMACPNGWTVESTRGLAEQWHMAPSAVRASRDRLASLGWLIVFPRNGQASDEDWLVWIAELYDPDLAMVDLGGPAGRATTAPATTGASNPSTRGGVESVAAPTTRLPHRPSTDSAQPATPRLPHPPQQAGALAATPVQATSPIKTTRLGQLERPMGAPSLDIHVHGTVSSVITPANPQLTYLRAVRRRRRRRALLDLMSPQSPPANRSSVVSQPHEVYLLHFPEENCFKVGLTLSTSRRIDDFARHGGIIVDRVQVANRLLAEIIEADVLASIHRF